MKLGKILMSTRKNSLRQKTIFTLSLFALGLVATGRFEKQTIQQNDRNPASESRLNPEKKIDLSQKYSNLKSCDYSPESHKICASQVRIK